jgi:hypothetical protein
MVRIGRSPLLECTYASWETFRDAMLNREDHGEFWSSLDSIDCLIGGLDYTMDYMQV